MPLCISLLLFGSLICFDAYAADEAQKSTDQATAFVYDPRATEEIRSALTSLKGNNDYEVGQDYLLRRDSIKRLLYMKADPNAHICVDHSPDFCRLCNVSTSSLWRALYEDDAEIAQLSLECGANPHQQGNCIPLVYAQSVKTAQLLIQYGAEVPEDIVQGRVAAHVELLGLFCNARRQKNLNAYCLSRLYQGAGARKKNVIPNSALFIWFGLNPREKIEVPRSAFPPGFIRTLPGSVIETTPLGILSSYKNPDLVHKVEILTQLVPRIKQEKREQRRQSFADLLASYITRDPAQIAIEYMEPVEPSWNENCWPEINTRMKQEEATNECSICSVS